jgi:hypothetical protein
MATTTPPTPSIAVSIGRQMRVYHAYVTSAPPDLDGPATLTLYTSTLADVAGLAADALDVPAARARLTARLVLIDTTELAWHRARTRADHHLFQPADPVLVSLRTLQHWLWQRLHAPLDGNGRGGSSANP